MSDELRGFVRDALSRNVSREKITAALKKGRWRDEEIRAALDAYVDDAEAGAPVPRRKPSLSASEAFQYLTIFLCLYICAFAAGTLLFNLADAAFPNPAEPWQTWQPSSVRMAIASLVVAFPVYVWMTVSASQAMRADPAKRDSPVRKWLTYLTLFITGGVAIGDLITLLYNLLEGDLPLRFACKVLAVLILAGGIFLGYFRGLRNDERVR